MNASERAFRKELLLVKGDALRMQVRIELSHVKQRFGRGGLILGTLATGRRLLTLFASSDSGHGWRRWLKTGLRSLLALQSWRKIWDRL